MVEDREQKQYPMPRNPIFSALLFATAAGAAVFFARASSARVTGRIWNRHRPALTTDPEDPMTETNTQPTEEEIAALAQRYWEDESRPEGRSVEHWHRAETELRQQLMERLAANSASPLPPAVAGIS
jgi:hypothetical protein